MYNRKTVDTWQIWVNYGQGWEHECTELSLAAMKVNVKAYRDNCPGIRIKVRPHREAA
jgi:hypothetical protein